MTRVLRAANGERRGEISFARATGDVRQKQIGGYAPPMKNVWAKNISPVPQMMRGRNGQAVTHHQWPTSGRKIIRPYKWMIGDAKRFANILVIGSGRGSDRVTEYQAQTMDDRVCEKVCEHIDD